MEHFSFQDKVTTELIQVLDDEERRWAQTLHIEEYQSNLARSVIQVQRSILVSLPKPSCKFLIENVNSNPYL